MDEKVIEVLIPKGTRIKKASNRFGMASLYIQYKEGKLLTSSKGEALFSAEIILAEKLVTIGAVCEWDPLLQCFDDSEEK